MFKVEFVRAYFDNDYIIDEEALSGGVENTLNIWCGRGFELVNITPIQKVIHFNSYKIEYQNNDRFLTITGGMMLTFKRIENVADEIVVKNDDIEKKNISPGVVEVSDNNYFKGFGVKYK